MVVQESGASAFWCQPDWGRRARARPGATVLHLLALAPAEGLEGVRRCESLEGNPSLSFPGCSSSVSAFPSLGTARTCLSELREGQV